eukprot:10590880-Lingulodinium_polyedra.AAC.1
MAVTALPDEYAKIASATKDKKWAEASTFAIWWQRAENCILQSWVAFVLEYPVTHVSLHFDGIR